MLQMLPAGPIPSDTVRVAQAAIPEGNTYLKLRNSLGTIFDDALFAPLFPTRGQPATAPWRLALVTILQFAEGLSDRHAADAVRVRIDWKYLLGLALGDPGFDYSILSRFRERLIEGNAEMSLLQALLERCRGLGLVRERSDMRTDSTHILASVRNMKRLELIGETLRAALNVLTIVDPVWLSTTVKSDWYMRYAKRFEHGRLARSKEGTIAVKEQIGRDGMFLLGAIWEPAAPTYLRTLPAVEALRQCWLSQFWTAVCSTGVKPVTSLPHLLESTRRTIWTLTMAQKDRRSGWATRSILPRRARREFPISSQTLTPLPHISQMPLTSHVDRTSLPKGSCCLRGNW
jgi:transposase